MLAKGLYQTAESFVKGLCKKNDMDIPTLENGIQSEKEFIEQLDKLIKFTTNFLNSSQNIDDSSSNDELNEDLYV